MNDEALREAIRGSFEDVRMRIPASTLKARGDRFRARRRMATVGATAVTAAAAAAVAVTMAAPAAAPHTPAAATAGASSRATTASPPTPSKPSKPSKPSGATLAAWTVTKVGDGTLKITIRDMRDPSALQATLRADGAQVVVTDSLAFPSGCHEWKGGDYRMGGDVVRMANKTGLPSRNGLEMYLRPSDIPSGAALWIGMYGKEVPGPAAFGYLTATTACLRN